MASERTESMQNLKSKKLYLRVYDELCNYIHANNLRPGDKLPTEMEMCANLGVSRNVLREAIKTLEITGVVASKPGVGITIRRPGSGYFLSSMINYTDNRTDEKQVCREVEQLRRVLELGFADAAFQSITPAEVSGMAQQLQIMESLGNHKIDGDKLGLEFAEADARFHALMYTQVNNNLLLATLDIFWAFDQYYLEPKSKNAVDIIVDKHRRIYNALYLRDLENFRIAISHHFTFNYEKE